MELSELLARENASVQAKEAEALAILTAHAGPAMQMLDGAKRRYGQVFPARELGAFISPEAEHAYQKGKREATRVLFDGYATTVFRQVLDAETFIAFLVPIEEKVREKLTWPDHHEAELCRLEWVRRAWERAKPTALQRTKRMLLSLWRSSADVRPLGRSLSQEQSGETADETPTAVPAPTATHLIGDRADTIQIAPASSGLFPNRALWLRGQLLDRGWSTSDPSKWGGPDRKTLDKILRGESVGNSVLLKLTEALSKVHGMVSVSNIPQD